MTLKFIPKSGWARISALALFSLLATAAASSEPKNITIATESWDLYTNADGSGLFLDITRAVYEPRGIRIDVEYVPYKRALLLLQQQKTDAMYGTYSAEIEGKPFLFTPRLPIDKEQTVAIFPRSRDPAWRGPASLEQARLAWVRGYDYHENLEVAIEEYDEVVDSEQGLKMLQAKRFDYFIDHSGALRDTISRISFDLSDYRIETVIEENVYMAFANNDRGRQLAAIYDQRVEQLIASGKLREIFNRYELPYPFSND